MFCKKCGKELEDNVRFCNYCGTEVGSNVVEFKEHLEIKSLKTVKVASHNISMNMFHQSR